jgi:hypothetical protein
MSMARRPWGIDQFDLAIAISAEPGRPKSLKMQRLEAGDLYHDELLARLHGFLRSHHPAGSSVLIAAALFSWGDAAHRALPPL